VKRIITTAVAVVVLALVPAALAASGLSGTYKETITSKKLFGGHLVGTWTIKLKGGGYTVKLNGRPVAKGTYTLSGSDLTVMDTPGPGSCRGTGKYSIKLSGTSLTFTKISDSCVSRVDVITYGTWMKIR
jgi:hypothetical protein